MWSFNFNVMNFDFLSTDLFSYLFWRSFHLIFYIKSDTHFMMTYAIINNMLIEILMIDVENDVFLCEKAVDREYREIWK